MPLNYLDRRIQLHDFAPMTLVSLAYYYTFYLAAFEGNALMSLPECKSICMLGNVIFMRIGMVSYSINLMMLLVRMKRFYPEYYEKLEKIDLALKACVRDRNKEGDILKKEAKIEKRWLLKELLTVVVLALAFLAAFYMDFHFLER